MFSVRILNISTKEIVSRARVVHNVNFYSSKKEIPKNPLIEVFTATHQSENGLIYDKKPFKLTLEEGKTYAWCLCGQSHTQPLCDGTHQSIYLKIKQRPIKFKVGVTKDYWLCNCKQSKNRPFCDGTHKEKHVQDAHIKV